MRLGVIIAVSSYSGSGLCDLPGCVQDAGVIEAILRAEDGCEDILVLTTNTNSATLKPKLIEFVNDHKGEDISEFVFYYTGHGVFLDDEYYYLLTDYQQTKRRQTALENTELDNLIRSLNPALTTKLVDSCQSGLPYIKDSGEVDAYLKGTQSGFQNCYFLFSSHTDESSYQDNVLSAFTRCLGELVASRTGVVRHKDIIDYVSDSFASNSLQTPFFVVQADFTDQFCTVNPALQKKVSGLLASVAKPSAASTVPHTAGSSLKALVEEDARYYCTKDEATAALIRIREYLEAAGYPSAEAQEIYRAEVTEVSEYSEIPSLVSIGKWLKESNQGFFAEPTSERVKVRRRVNSIANALRGIAIGMRSLSSDEDEYEEVFEDRVSGAKSTTELPFAGLLLRANPLYPNINTTACFLVPFVSRTHVLVFAGPVAYVARGWGEPAEEGEIKWRPFAERLKDDDAIDRTLSRVVKDFWEYTMSPVRKKFGLVTEEPESEQPVQVDEDGTGEPQAPCA